MSSRKMFACVDCVHGGPDGTFVDAIGGYWEVDFNYMRDECEDPNSMLRCGPCYNGEPEEHEPWSESSPKWACEVCGTTNVMFNEVYRLLEWVDVPELPELVETN